MSALQTADAPRIVHAACPHDCPDTCAMLVHVKDGVAVKVTGNPDHPNTGGALCTKVSRYAERTYHPDRVLHPLKRVGAKGEGRFERVSWDEALDAIAARLRAIAAVDPERIVPYSYAGTMGLVQGEGMAARFFNKLGASRLDRTICSTAGSVGMGYTIGARLGPDPLAVAAARTIVFWGTNAIGSNLHFWTVAQEAKRRGARLIAIDPFRSLTAEKCHAHIAPLPGTDAALALGVMHVLVRNDWLDHDYIAQHTLGFDALKARLADYPPERVAKLCGITADEVEMLARELWGARERGGPAFIRVSYGVQRVHGGGMAVRNIGCIPALTGDWRHPAGGVLLSTSGAFPTNPDLGRPDLLAGRNPRTINMSTIGDDLLRPAAADFAPIEALIVYNSNPLAVAPESAKVAQGFARTDLFTVVLEHFLTDTADYADYVLPATTQLEHFDVVKPYGHYSLMANTPAIAPLGEAKPNSEIFRLLAKRMGYVDACFDESDETIARQTLRLDHPYAKGFDWDRCIARGWERLNVPEDWAPFAEGGFTTPSGKCEFESAQMAAAGLDPLPAYIAPHEGADSAAAARYPLAMISPPARNFLNSSFVNVTSLRATEGEPVLELHADDAHARGIADGQTVRVFNDRGELRLRARVGTRARPGVVVGLSIWWKKFAADGKNVNELTSQRLTDMGRAPTFYDCRVEVQPWLEAAAEPMQAAHA